MTETPTFDVRPPQNCPTCGQRGRYTGRVLEPVTLTFALTPGATPLPVAEHSCPNGHRFPGIGGLRLVA